MNQKDITNLHGITNCITGEPESFSLFDSTATPFQSDGEVSKHRLYSGPGLIDLQVNGINGIDFNTPGMTPGDLISANQYLLGTGVTSFFPTVITNSDENLLKLLAAIHQACLSDELLNACVAGIHLEGPFISPTDGARGAHHADYVKAPDWELFSSLQKAAGGRISIVTLAPEWENAPEFIEKCTRAGVIVSIGHSLANSAQIKNAVNAGACMSTHLGNGVPLMLPRHPNLIWDQLAEEQLYSCVIADGIHVPDSFLKVVFKTKGCRSLIVSDATCFAGMEPGEYKTYIGGAVVLEQNKRLSVKGGQGILAGAAKSIRENVETMLEHHLCSLGDAWRMASANVSNFLNRFGKQVKTNEKDLVIFSLDGTAIVVNKVFKNGTLVFSK